MSIKLVNRDRYNELIEKERNYDKLYQAFEKQKEISKKTSYEKNEIIRKYDNLKTDLKKLIAKNIKNESENDYLTFKTRELKNQIYDIDNNWHAYINKAWRINPTTKKIEKYEIPKNFNKNNVEDFDFNEDLTMCKIKYDGRYYPLPSSLLENKFGINLFNKKNKINDISKIKCSEDVKNFIKNKGFYYDQGYWIPIIEFIIFNRGGKFSTSEFTIGCKIKNRESQRIYLNHLIDIGLINRIEKGKFKILFDFE